MIRHLVRLVWNRKRASALLILEIFASFLVVFAVATLGLYFAGNARRPLGYDWRGVWNVAIDVEQTSDDEFTPEQSAAFARLLDEAAALPQVAAAAGALTVPYGEGRSEGPTRADEDAMGVMTEVDEVTDGFREVLGLDLVAGRWFEPGDDALVPPPAVLNREAARALFGAEDPIGRTVIRGSYDLRVVGLVDDFRRGELAGSRPYLFERTRPGHPQDRPPRNLLLRMRPGTPAAFEEELVRRLQRVAPEWSFEARPLERMRRSSLRLRLVPLAAAGLVAFFLMVMVGLGLLGVLWQNLLRRTREIGLRRAVGASRASVHRQVLLEQLLLTTVGVLLGAALVVQLPLLELLGGLPPGVFAGGLLIAVAALYLLAALASLYPSWLAGRVQPAEALRYE